MVRAQPALSDRQIAAMAPAERRELIVRLGRNLDDVVSPTAVARIRRVRFGLMVGGTLVLIPWIVYLAATLPDRHLVTHWTLTWVGFDAVLVTLMAVSAYLGWRRRALFVLTAVATATMLVCDAWFDITTAGAGDVWVSWATAVFAELPLAALLMFGAVRLTRLMGTRLWLLGPGDSVWTLRLPV